MTPYYQDEAVTLYHGDCREVLPHLSGVDLVLTDPPYGVGMRAFDDDFAAGVAGLLMAPGTLAAVFMSPRRVVELASAVAGEWSFERLLWMHKSADMAAPWHGWCMNSEAILVLSRPRHEWPKAPDYRADIYQVGPWERAGHPNGKPTWVVRDLVRRMCRDVVLDPFAGSGTTLRAAKDLGKRAIGIEIDERYCEVIAGRLQQSVMPLEMLS